MKCKECGHKQKYGQVCAACGVPFKSTMAQPVESPRKKNRVLISVIISLVVIGLLLGGWFLTKAFISDDEPADDESSGELEAIGIAIEDYPTKMKYEIGEKPDFSGMTVSILFSDQSTKTYVKGWECTYHDFTHEGAFLITVHFKGLKTTFTMNVVDDADKVVESIAVVKLPDKLEYSIDDRPDYTGLTVEATYSDGTKEIVTGVACYVHPLDQVGVYEVTVEYDGQETTFNIHVH